MKKMKAVSEIAGVVDRNGNLFTREALERAINNSGILPVYDELEGKEIGKAKVFSVEENEIFKMQATVEFSSKESFDEAIRKDKRYVCGFYHSGQEASKDGSVNVISDFRIKSFFLSIDHANSSQGATKLIPLGIKEKVWDLRRDYESNNFGVKPNLLLLSLDQLMEIKKTEPTSFSNEVFLGMKVSVLQDPTVKNLVIVTNIPKLYEEIENVK